MDGELLAGPSGTPNSEAGVVDGELLAGPLMPPNRAAGGEIGCGSQSTIKTFVINGFEAITSRMPFYLAFTIVL